MTYRREQSPILVGVDGSPSAQDALDWAAAEASTMHRPLHIVHCAREPAIDLALGIAGDMSGPRRVTELPPTTATGRLMDGGIRAGERVLADAEVWARSAAPDVKVTSEMVVAAPAPTMLRKAQDAEMLVVGSRGLGGFTGLLVGSVGATVAAHASCPVVVVHPRSDARPPTRRVVVGVDGSPLSTPAISFAFEAASRRGTGLTALLAWSVTMTAQPARMTPVDRIEDDERGLLVESLAAARQQFPDVDVQSRLVRARPSPTLVVESARAGLLVVGSRGRGGFRGLLLGSVSRTVLHHAQCPVAVVRGGRFARST